MNTPTRPISAAEEMAPLEQAYLRPAKTGFEEHFRSLDALPLHAPLSPKWTAPHIATYTNGSAICEPTSFANAIALARSEAYRQGLNGGRDVSVYRVKADGTLVHVETVRGAEPMSREELWGPDAGDRE